jgi:predicted DCC family thiol-disulfide oxidoreductase YuxK
MISLASEMTDGKGRHARGWLFYDADCKFCTGIAKQLMNPMKGRGLAVAPLQDPRVASLLGLSPVELLQAIRFVRADGSHYVGVTAVLAVAQELWWARPLVWLTKLPGMMPLMRAVYRWIAQRRRCSAEHCIAGPVASRS